MEKVWIRYNQLFILVIFLLIIKGCKNVNNDVIKEKRKDKYILYKRKKGFLFLIINIGVREFFF